MSRVLAALLMLGAGLVAQERGESGPYESPPPDPAALAAAPEDFEELLTEQGLLLDVEGRSVSVRGGVLHDKSSLGYPIEYLVVTERGKTHEASFLIKARPSVLDACLRAIGLEPGQPTVVQLKDPLPSEADLASGKESPWDVQAAHGPLVSIVVSWTDAAGARHDESLESLLINTQSGEPLRDAHWIYTGSRIGEIRRGKEVDRRFLADLHGDVVAIYLDGVGASMFERNSLEGLDDSLYTLNPEAMPNRGTPVMLTFQPTGLRVEPEAAPEAAAAEGDDEG